MPDYPAMYRKLFAEQVSAIDRLKEITESLIKVHQQVEEIYINSPELEIKLINNTNILKNDNT